MSHGAHLQTSCHTSEWVMSHIWMSHVTHLNEPCHTCKIHKADTVTGWRRPIKCLKLQVICRKRAINYRALLQKTTQKDKASYGSSPLFNAANIGIWHIQANESCHTYRRVMAHVCRSHGKYKWSHWRGGEGGWNQSWGRHS